MKKDGMLSVRLEQEKVNLVERIGNGSKADGVDKLLYCYTSSDDALKSSYDHIKELEKIIKEKNSIIKKLSNIVEGL